MKARPFHARQAFGGDIIHIFEENDYVKIISDAEDDVRIGEVLKIGRKYVTVRLGGGEDIKILPEKLEYIPPLEISREQAEKLCRFELKFSDVMTEDRYDGVVCTGDERYHVTPCDIIAALENMKKSGLDGETAFREWFIGIDPFGKIYDYEDKSPDKYFGLPDDSYAIDHVRGFFAERFCEFMGIKEFSAQIRNIPESTVSDAADEMIRYLNNYLADKKKPLAERYFSDEEKHEFIYKYDSKMLSVSSPEIVKLYRKFVDELAESDFTAKEARAYGHFGGNAAFECDYKAALAELLEYFECYGDSVEMACRIGYIYYKGLADDSPDYEKAFRYFSIAAAGGNSLANIFLSEMYADGKGVPQSNFTDHILTGRLRVDLEEDLYSCNFEYFEYAALLISKMKRDTAEDLAEIDYRDWLTANFMLKRSSEISCHYGENELLKTAEEAVTRIGKNYSRAAKNGRITFYSVHELFYTVLCCAIPPHDRHIWEMTYKQLKNGDIRLTFRILPFGKYMYSRERKMFVCIPEFGFCGYLDKISFRLTDIEIFEVTEPGKPVPFDYNFYMSTDNYSSFNGTLLTLYGHERAKIGGKLILEDPLKKNVKKYRFVSATRSAGIMSEYGEYLCDDENISAGDIVKIPQENVHPGYEYALAVCVYEKYEYELAYDIGEYERICGERQG